MTARLSPELPLIRLEGTPYEQGHQYGSICWKKIERNLELYARRFTEEGGLTESEIYERASLYWDVIKRHSEPYAQALRGMAIGSGHGLMQIVALNVRYEIMYHQFVVNSNADGCSAVAVAPQRSQNRHLLMAENWDWFSGVHGVMLHTRNEGVETLAFSEAGIFGGKIGLNSYGLGLAINGLNSTIDDWSRLRKPFHLMCFEVLQSSSITDAVEIVSKGSRSCSANFLIGQIESHIVDVETAPQTTRILEPHDGLLTHTNHFLDPKLLGIEEPNNDCFDYSDQRLRRIHQLAVRQERISVENLMEIMRDHSGEPYSLCRHIDPELAPSEHYETVVSLVMDLHERAVWVAAGLPCQCEYVPFTLSRAAVTFQ